VRRARLAALAAAAAGYAVLAWNVAPGFFDATGPPPPYRWISPPPNLAHGNLPPAPGHLTLKTGSNHQVDPGTVFSGEAQPQASLSFLPGSFPAAVTIDITPEATFPPTTGLQCETNVYLVAASQPLQKEALIDLSYSDAVPAPSDIYRAPADGGEWTKIGSSGGAAFQIAARTTALGYFAGCFPAGSLNPPRAGPTIGGGQTLPIVAALAIVLVVIGGIPLALLRRRGAIASKDK
jgi:hypothetical protein